jgi:Glyoxalase-like domain
VEAEAGRLASLGASVFREVEERGEHWIVMQDPEGNEFCVQ